MSHLLLSLVPDLVSAKGHYRLYERQIARQCRARDMQHVSLTGYISDPSGLEGAETSIEQTFAFGSKFLAHVDPDSRAGADIVRDYARAVTRSLEAQKDRGFQRMTLFSYMSSDVECRALHYIARAHPDVVFALNIFWAADLWRLDHVRAISALPNVSILAQALGMGETLDEAGIPHKMLPHPAPNDSEDLDLTRARPFRCYIPIKSVSGKNVSEDSGWLKALETLRDQRIELESGFVYPRPGHEGSADWIRNAALNKSSYAIDPYMDFLTEVDGVVLPYDLAEFRLRTSGIAADCAVSGTSVLCLQGTDMARRADDLDRVVNEASLIEDVRAWLGEDRRFEDRQAKATAYRAGNNWPGFLDAILAGEGGRSSLPTPIEPEQQSIQNADPDPAGQDYDEAKMASEPKLSSPSLAVLGKPSRTLSNRYRHRIEIDPETKQISVLIYGDPYGDLARIAVDLERRAVLFIQRLHPVLATVRVGMCARWIEVDCFFNAPASEPVFYATPSVGPPSALSRTSLKETPARLLGLHKPGCALAGSLRDGATVLEYRAFGFDGYTLEEQDKHLIVSRGHAPVSACLVFNARSECEHWSLRLVEAGEGVAVQITRSDGTRSKLLKGDALPLSFPENRNRRAEVRVLGSMDGRCVLALSAVRT